MKSVFLWGSVGLLIAGGLIAVVSYAPPGQSQHSLPEDIGPDYSVEVLYEGATHVSEGTDVSYNSNPPTSGSHWPDPLLDGIYDVEKPEEALVHSLEHGRIWISYQPSLPSGVIDTLKDIASGQARVILTPRSANETHIALAAWQRLDAFDVEEGGVFDDRRILDFIARYRDKGPEYVPQMTGKRYE